MSSQYILLVEYTPLKHHDSESVFLVVLVHLAEEGIQVVDMAPSKTKNCLINLLQAMICYMLKVIYSICNEHIG